MKPYTSPMLALTVLCTIAACGEEPKQEETLIVIEEEDHGHHHHHGGDDMDTAPDQAPEDMDTPDDGGPQQPSLLDGQPQLTMLYKAPQADLLTTDLEFNPQEPGQLWLLQRWPESEARCDSRQQTSAGCTALEGSVTIITNLGTLQQRAERLVDPNGWHFMRRPTAIAFGAPGTFGTCAEERTGNYLDDSADFIGPTLWSSDLDVFAQDPGVDENGDPLNGSHLDMLHETPYCMGIAHETANSYWTFNGQIGAIDRYNFNADHGPGYHDHSDGELRRYVVGQLKRVPGVPSHMAYDRASRLLYIADTGNGRVVRLDPNTGTNSGPASPVYEPLAVNQQIEGAELIEIVPPGTITRPSGLLLHAGRLYVGDNATGKLHAFGLDGSPQGVLQTSIAPGALAGINIGPDGKLYLVDMLRSELWRLDP